MDKGKTYTHDEVVLLIYNAIYGGVGNRIHGWDTEPLREYVEEFIRLNTVEKDDE